MPTLEGVCQGVASLCGSLIVVTAKEGVTALCFFTS